MAGLRPAWLIKCNTESAGPLARHFSSAGGSGSEIGGSVGPMTATPREFDIVLYGATGFVGKLTAEYLARAGGAARVALGRQVDRATARRSRHPGGIRAVLAACWPPTRHRRRRWTRWPPARRSSSPRSGPTPATGCHWWPRARRAGTDYADLTGEAPFIREQHRPLPQAGRRHRGPHRALLRIRLRPFGSERVRAVPGGAERTTRASSATPTSSCAPCPADYPGAPSRRCSKCCTPPRATPTCVVSLPIRTR